MYHSCNLSLNKRFIIKRIADEHTNLKKKKTLFYLFTWFVSKRSIFHYRKLSFRTFFPMWQGEFTDKKYANNEGCRYFVISSFTELQKISEKTLYEIRTIRIYYLHNINLYLKILASKKTHLILKILKY